jgi:hypothetical protein
MAKKDRSKKFVDDGKGITVHKRDGKPYKSKGKKDKDKKKDKGKKKATLLASDRTSLIKLARSLPKGDPDRRAILAGLKKLEE